jgi:hypothetical protein
MICDICFKLKKDTQSQPIWGAMEDGENEIMDVITICKECREGIKDGIIKQERGE